MKAYAKNIKGSGIVRNEISCDISIEIHHLEGRYILMEDATGKLILMSIEGLQLILLPRGSNSVEILSQ